MKLLLMVLLLSLCCSTIYADYNTDVTTAKELLAKYNVIDDNTFANDKVVTRDECVNTIMKAIGLNEEILKSQYGGGTNEYTLYGKEIIFFRVKYAMDAGVVSGEFGADDNDNPLFCPSRAVTTKEVLAFMVRCLEDNSGDIDNTFKRAEELELIRKTDSFYEDSDLAIDQDDFYILLNRFLNQKRYLYYSGEYEPGFYLDDSREISYLDNLIRQQNGYINLINFNEDISKICKIIHKKFIRNADIVTRDECVNTIMRAIGSNEETLKKQDNVLWEGKFWIYDDGVRIATRVRYASYEGIVSGEFGKKGTTDLFFYPSKAVTVNETLAFMVRCLEKDGGDLNYSYKRAKELGLINETDSFYKNIDGEINLNDFFTLLSRFLNQKRYFYYSGEYEDDIRIDNEGSMTYLEYLKQRQEDEQSSGETENTHPSLWGV